MRKNTASTACNVINLPRTFHSVGNASIYDLLKESGYFAEHDHVTECAIHNALRSHPELARDWMDFSDDKRASAGWFLRSGGPKGYQVGYYPGNEVLDFSDLLAACAAFVKREIEDIRTDSARA